MKDAALSLGKKLQTQADWVIFMHGLVDNLHQIFIKTLLNGIFCTVIGDTQQHAGK